MTHFLIEPKLGRLGSSPRAIGYTIFKLGDMDLSKLWPCCETFCSLAALAGVEILAAEER